MLRHPLRTWVRQRTSCSIFAQQNPRGLCVWMAGRICCGIKQNLESQCTDSVQPASNPNYTIPLIHAPHGFAITLHAMMRPLNLTLPSPPGKDVVHLIVSRTASGSSVRFAAAFAAMEILWSQQRPKVGRVGTPVTSPSAKRARLTSPPGEVKTPTAAETKPALIE